VSSVRSPPFPRVAAFFHRHPMLLLLALSPGIPEYLSGSSSTSLLVRSPVVFLVFLGLNLGLYGPGVLLVREALFRWGKGWAALLCLGAAYGLLEEGTALSTLFNPTASVVAGLGVYGHYLGVNWVWVIGVLQVHIVLSIGLPILLLGLALPETRGKSLLTDRQVGLALGVFALDIVVLVAISHYYPVGLLWQGLAVLVAGALAFLAYRLPRDLLDPTSERPRWGPGVCLLLGLAFYPIIVLVPGLAELANVAAPIAGAAEIVVSGALFFAVRHAVGRSDNAAQMVLLALGALIPIALIGLIAQIFLPVELVVTVPFVLFFYALWRKYRPVPSDRTPRVPAGAT
jgi:hypothetical protein